MLPVFDFLRNFVKIIQICMAYCRLNMTGGQELEFSLIENQS